MSLIDAHADQAAALLDYYSFDLMGYSATQWVQSWQQVVATDWIRAAVVEALHQGRYKAVSVEQLLRAWQRRQEPLRHFSHEFERMICSPFDQRLTYGYQPSTSCSESVEAATATAPPAAAKAAPQMAQNFELPARSPLTIGSHHFGQTTRQPQQTLQESRLAVAKLGTSPPPIVQFVPIDEDSEFYTKLRAVAHQTN
ncbi:MAG: hypothetical protein ACTS3T_17680 [Almyronema sp.]